MGRGPGSPRVAVVDRGVAGRHDPVAKSLPPGHRRSGRGARAGTARRGRRDRPGAGLAAASDHPQRGARVASTRVGRRPAVTWGGYMQELPAAAQPVLYEVEAMPKLANWRPLVQWFLAIPHWIIASILNSVSGVLALISFFAILFTGNIPAGLFDFQVMTFRYRARVTGYSMFFHDKYPAFDFTTSANDPGGDPVQLSIERPQKFNRWLPLVKWLFIIPHLVVLVVLAIAGF